MMKGRCGSSIAGVGTGSCFQMNSFMCDAADLLPTNEVEDQRTLRGDEGRSQVTGDTLGNIKGKCSPTAARGMKCRDRGALVGRATVTSRQPHSQSCSHFSSAKTLRDAWHLDIFTVPAGLESAHLLQSSTVAREHELGPASQRR